MLLKKVQVSEVGRHLGVSNDKFLLNHNSTILMFVTLDIGSNKSRDTLSSSASTNPPGSSVGAMPVSAAPLSSNQDDKEEFSPTTPNETNI